MVGRYALYGEIAKGGMATVYFGRLLGPVGFSRTVAIKRLHPHYASDAEFVAMFLDEARLAARVQHPNVVSTLDVVALDGELMLVMEYIQGESLSRLMSTLRAAGERIPWRIIAAVMNGVLTGLHAAHEARNERGEPLGIVHRDMSPQNVLVGADGVVRVFDFGVAKAAGRAQDTRQGQFKGKLAYASPEQLAGAVVDRRVDLYAATVVFWEMVTGRRMFKADDEKQLYAMVREGRIDPPSRHVTDIPAGLEAIIMRGLANDPALRFSSAHEMAVALEEVMHPASTREVAEWVGRVARQSLERRKRSVEEIELSGPTLPPDSGVRDLVPMVMRGSLPPSSAGAPYSQAEPPKKKRGALIVALLLIVLSGVVGAVIALRPSGQPTVIEEPQTASKPRKSEAAEPTKAVAAAAPEPQQVTEPQPKPAPMPAPAPKLAAKPTAKTSVSAAAPTAAAPAANCSPPFTIDEDGIRHPKPECM